VTGQPAPVFRFPVRVYYEDTDAGGVVYHANYLRFMERARSEWLRHLGLEHADLAREHDLLFVVRSAQLQFLRPARLADLLTVQLSVARLRRSAIHFDQHVLRGEECLSAAEIVVVAVAASSFRPCALPGPVAALLQPWLPAAPAV
jgi:acyl-CoA thioester hydrolase